MLKKLIYLVIGLILLAIGWYGGHATSPDQYSLNKIQQLEDANAQYVQWSKQVTKSFHDMCNFYHANCPDIPFHASSTENVLQ